MLALVDGIQPRVLGLQDIIIEYIKHRQSVVRRRTEFELRKAQERAHILEGLKLALDHIDEVIKTIRASRTTEEAQANLIKQFKLTEIQARAILAMQLRTPGRAGAPEDRRRVGRVAKADRQTAGDLADEKKILKIIKDEIAEMKDRFGDERRTKIIPQELGKLSDETWFRTSKLW